MRGLSPKVLGSGTLNQVELAPCEVVLGKAEWLIRLRWLAIVAQIGCIPLGLRFGVLAPSALGPYEGIVACLIALNLYSHVLLRFRPTWISMGMIFAQMALDLIALSTLLAVSGGCFNPLFALLYLHAALGALVLSPRWSKAYLALCVGCLAVVCVTSEFGAGHADHLLRVPRAARLTAELLVMIVIWSLTYWFSRSVESLRAERDLLQHQRQRGDHLKALGAMAASFSHEFSTPLNTAKIRSERLARRHPEMAQDEDFRASLAALDQCEATLRDLFETDQKAFTSHFDEIDLVAFVRRVCERWQTGRGDLRLSVAAESSHVSCKAPQVVLAKSLVDLLDNAAEACGPALPEIDVSIRTSGGQIAVAIADRGSGMPPEIKSRLGDPFVSSKPGGMGLGVYSTNALMDALGGSLKVESRARGGTVVTLLFPLHPGVAT